MKRKMLSKIIVIMLLLSCTIAVQTVFGIANDETIINPLPGQYADYSVEYHENEEISYSGWFNISYIEYLEPNLINTTIWIDIPDGTGLFWYAVDTSNRRIPYGSIWENYWYPFWIETNVTEGSRIRIMDVTWEAVVGSETQMGSGKIVDCWVVNYTSFDFVYSFFFDKETGVCVVLDISSIYYSMVLQLVATNIPIGVSFPHDLAVYLNVPIYLPPNETTTFEVTVYNYGQNDEPNVEVQLFIDGNMVNSTIVTLLKSEDSSKLTHTWSSTDYGTYNVTADVFPVPEEFSEENNRMTRFVRVSSSPGVGVKIGDWIKYDYIISDIPPGTPSPEWMKVEILDIEGTIVNMNVTMHMSDETEQNEIMQLDVLAGYGPSVTFAGLIIPTDLTTGDEIYLTGIGNFSIMGESVGIYAGAMRTTVFIRLSMQGSDFTYYWDKETGILVEVDSIYPQLNIAATAKATETNIWQSNTIIRLSPSEMSVSLGVTFTFDVTVTNATDVYTWQIELFFDPKVLNCTGASYSDEHIFSGKEIVAVNPVIDNDEGYVLYGCCLLGDEETFNGNGTLCQIQFTAISSGKTTISFSGPEDTFLLDSELNDMPLGTYEAYLQAEGLYCDLNNDGRVDILDLAEAAHAFGSCSGHPRWNPIADVNRDNSVDILDLCRIAINFNTEL